VSLKNAWKNAKLASEREHVTPYIRKNPEYKLVNMECRKDMSNKRWTLDNLEDYEFIKIIFENLYGKNPLFGMEEILTFIDEKPEIERINENIVRNEGYKKSVREDRLLNLDNIQET
jgi:spore coat polysaccharide biosynthesis protein SpsF